MTPAATPAARGRSAAGSAGALASAAARRGLPMASPDERATGGVVAERASSGAVVPGRIAAALPSGAGAVGGASVAPGGVTAEAGLDAPGAPLPALSDGLTRAPVAAGPPLPRAAPLAAPNREASTAWRPRYA